MFWALQYFLSKQMHHCMVSSKGISGAKALMLICTVEVEMSILVRSSSLVGVATPPISSRYTGNPSMFSGPRPIPLNASPAFPIPNDNLLPVILSASSPLMGYPLFIEMRFMISTKEFILYNSNPFTARRHKASLATLYRLGSLPQAL